MMHDERRAEQAQRILGSSSGVEKTCVIVLGNFLEILSGPFVTMGEMKTSLYEQLKRFSLSSSLLAELFEELEKDPNVAKMLRNKYELKSKEQMR